MGSKVIVFLALLLAIVLLISSEVAARDLADTSNTMVTSSETTAETTVNDAKYPGGEYEGYPGRGYEGYPGRGGYGEGYPRRGGYCRFGCCGRRFFGYGCRCCPYPAAAKAEAEPQSKPQN